MKNILLITQNILKMTFRKKSNIFVYIILPIIISIISMTVFSNSSTKPLNVGIIDMDNSSLSEDMVKAIDEKNSFIVEKIKMDDMKDFVTKHKIDCAVIIPSGYEKDIFNRISPNIEITSIKGAETTIWIGNFINYYTEGILDISKASSNDRDIFNKMYEGLKNNSAYLNIENVHDKSFNKGITQVNIGFLLMFVMLGTGFTSNYILRERRNRTYFRICSAPVKSSYYVLANVISGLIIIGIQSLAVIFAITKLLKVETFIPDLQLFIVLMCFGLAALGLSLAIVAFSKSSNQASMLNTLIVTPTCMLGGCYWTTEIMPEWLQRVGNFVPQSWTLKTIAKLQGPYTFIDVLPNIAIILCFAVVFFLVAIYKFNRRRDARNFI